MHHWTLWIAEITITVTTHCSQYHEWFPLAGTHWEMGQLQENVSLWGLEVFIKNRIQFCAGWIYSEQNNKGLELLRCHFGTTQWDVMAAPTPQGTAVLRFRAVFLCRCLRQWVFHLCRRCVPEQLSVIYLLLQSGARVPGVSATFAR